MKRFLVLVLSTVTAYGGICSAQKCPVGCESKIDTLENQVAAQARTIEEVPYVEKFRLTASADAHGLSSERELPDYADVLLVHVSVDQEESAVLFPTPQIPTSIHAACRTQSGDPVVEVPWLYRCFSYGEAERVPGPIAAGSLRQECVRSKDHS